MIFGIFISSFPISPLIQKVNALANVSGDKIIETAMTYGDWSYDEVGTCTGLVTRTLNKLGSRWSQRRLLQSQDPRKS